MLEYDSLHKIVEENIKGILRRQSKEPDPNRYRTAIKKSLNSFLKESFPKLNVDIICDDTNNTSRELDNREVKVNFVPKDDYSEKILKDNGFIP
jgi:hypothetical protein